MSNLGRKPRKKNKLHFALNWEIKQKWGLVGTVSPSVGSVGKEVAGGEVLEKFTIFSLKLVYSFLVETVGYI